MNAWTLAQSQQEDSNKQPLYAFKAAAAKAMMNRFQVRPDVFGRIETGDGDRMLASKHGDTVGQFKVQPRVRYDGYYHLPEQIASKARRCAMENCKRCSTFWCMKCNSYLCVDK